MANINEKVMDMVRREIAKNPDVKSGELYEEAKKLDRSMSSLSLRQFHAQYPLQVKRAMKTGARVSKPRKSAAKKKRAARKAATKRGGRKAGKKAATKKTARKKTAARKGRAAKKTRSAAKKTRPAAKKARKKAATRRTRRAAGTRRPAKRAASGARRKAAGEGGTVRSVLLKFAAQVASAEDKADMIQVIADMDRWVERVMKAVR